MPLAARAAVKGRLVMGIEIDEPDAAVLEGVEVSRGWRRDPDTGLWSAVVERDNAFLTQGLVAILRRYFTLATVPAAPTGIAVSSDNTAVTAATTQFGGTFRYNAFSATPTFTGTTTVSAVATGFTKGAAAGQVDFAVRKVGLTNATTDAVGAVQDIIGGAGSAPYNEPLNIDLTGAGAFTITPQIDVTLIAV